MIKAIIFDCFGVLYSDGKSYLRNLCPPNQQAELDNLYSQVDYGYISTEEFFKEASRLIGLDKETLQQTYFKQHVRNQQLVDYLKSLKTSYKIGLLSNVGDSLFDALFSKEEQKEFFDATVLSSSIGEIKPHPRAYQAVIEKLKVEPEECVMIDDIPANCEGARQAGMQAVHFVSNEKLKQQLKHLLALQ
ncbi:HAD family phosphatase [Candidatus Saccharibacteria bacterium]|nr:HAD family phosphatase [Candidatus Saccharibacteria bacterium]